MPRRASNTSRRNVYVIRHDDVSYEWPHASTGVVIGKDKVLIVDTAYLPSRTEADIALIRKLTDKPARWLVYTHWHMDHNNGAAAYKHGHRKRRPMPGSVTIQRGSAALSCRR